MGTLFESSEGDRAKEHESDERMDDATAFEEYKRLEELAKIKWRAAESILKLRSQVDAKFPNRKKASDGIIGDSSHCPNSDGTGNSDHCPNITDGDFRIVTAIDITDDPASGCSMELITEAVRSSMDSRVKYIIWNKRICNQKAVGGTAPWEWRPYSGANGHTKHAHFSVVGNKAKYDSTSDWSIE